MAICDKCGRREADAWYEYHYGTFVRTEPSGSHEVDWYRDIRQGGAYVCSPCGDRHVVLRYVLPFGLVPMLLLATAYGPVVGIGIYFVLAVVLAVVTASVGPGAWWCVQHAAARSRSVILPVLGLALVWATGTFGLIGSFIFGIARPKANCPAGRRCLCGCRWRRNSCCCGSFGGNAESWWRHWRGGCTRPGCG